MLLIDISCLLAFLQFLHFFYLLVFFAVPIAKMPRHVSIDALNEQPNGWVEGRGGEVFRGGDLSLANAMNSAPVQAAQPGNGQTPRAL